MDFQRLEKKVFHQPIMNYARSFILCKNCHSARFKLRLGFNFNSELQSSSTLPFCLGLAQQLFRFICEQPGIEFVDLIDLLHRMRARPPFHTDPTSRGPNRGWNKLFMVEPNEWVSIHSQPAVGRRMQSSAQREDLGRESAEVDLCQIILLKFKFVLSFLHYCFLALASSLPLPLAARRYFWWKLEKSLNENSPFHLPYQIPGKSLN